MLSLLHASSGFSSLPTCPEDKRLSKPDVKPTFPVPLGEGSPAEVCIAAQPFCNRIGSLLISALLAARAGGRVVCGECGDHPHVGSA